ncbi:MAG: hypothetical protein K5637_07575 [Lachnospiraceae bacterium]|nr:hypothetical protein [Lachnospiraceae bacterium]
MKKIPLECPKCGAPLKLDRRNRSLTCEYCGYTAIYENENNQKPFEPEQDRSASSCRSSGTSSRRTQRRTAKTASPNRKKGCLVGCLTAIIAFIVLMVIGVIITETTSSSRSYTYTEDESAKVINPFNYVDVRFKGLDGEGEVVFDVDETEVEGLYFYSEDNYDLHEGDVITVTAYELYGYRFTQTEKQYTVTGLDHYLSSISELNDEALADIYSGAMIELEDDFGPDSALMNDEKVTVTGPEPIGMYLLYTDDESEWTRNMLFAIFTCTLTSGDKKTVIYIPVEYDRIVVKTSGLAKLDYNYAYIRGDYLWTTDLGFKTSAYLRGYISEKAMYFDIVKSNSSEYTSDVSGGLSEF